jgi:hypothetical protein
VTAETFEPLGNICSIANLAQFTVAHDADTGFNLFLHGVIDRHLDDLFKVLGVDLLAMITRKQQLRQLFTAGETANMGGQNSHHVPFMLS